MYTKQTLMYDLSIKMQIAKGAQKTRARMLVPTISDGTSCCTAKGNKPGPKSHTAITLYATKLDRVPGSVAAYTVFHELESVMKIH